MSTHDNEYYSIKRKAVLEHFNKSNVCLSLCKDSQKRKEQLLDLFHKIYSPTVELTEICSVVSDTCSSSDSGTDEYSVSEPERDVYEFTDSESNDDVSGCSLYTDRISSRFYTKTRSHLQSSTNNTQNDRLTPNHELNIAFLKRSVDTNAQVDTAPVIDSVSEMHPNTPNLDIEQNKPIQQLKENMHLGDDGLTRKQPTEDCNNAISNHSTNNSFVRPGTNVTTSTSERTQSNDSFVKSTKTGHCVSHDSRGLSTTGAIIEISEVSTIQIITESVPSPNIKNTDNTTTGEATHQPYIEHMHSIITTPQNLQNERKNKPSLFLKDTSSQKRKTVKLDNSEELDIEYPLHNDLSQENSPCPAKKKRKVSDKRKYRWNFIIV